MFPLYTFLMKSGTAPPLTGAIHSIVFGGFSAKSLADRLLDAKADLLVTADGVYRGDKPVFLKKIADEAMKMCKVRALLCFGLILNHALHSVTVV